MQGLVAQGEELCGKGAAAAGLKSNVNLLVDNLKEDLRRVADVEALGDNGRLVCCVGVVLFEPQLLGWEDGRGEE